MSTKKAIGGSLGAIVLLVAAQIVAELAANLLNFLHIPAAICNVLAGVIYIGIAFVLLKLFAEKWLKVKINDLGMPKFSIQPKWIAAAIGLPVIVKAVYLLLFSGEYVFSGMDSRQICSILSAGIAFVGIAAGFVEEMVFRGVIFHFIKARWNSKAAVLVPSVAFGAVHLIGMDFSPISCLLVLAAGTMVGVMFSMIVMESGSVWNSGIVHALWNIIINGGGLTISQKAEAYSVVTYVLKSKSILLTGGEFGVESSLVALIGYLIVALAAIAGMKKTSHKSER